jgi:glycosyltransferase involved in cell wall biosynthesis
MDKTTGVSMNESPLQIGFVSTRIAGTDGVSLEIQKWADVLTQLGHTCVYFAGLCDRPAEESHVVPEAHFAHPEIRKLTDGLFRSTIRSPETTEHVHLLRGHLKENLYKFIERFDIDLIIAQNCLSLPMNVPLGLAVKDLVIETNIPTIGHHHDFGWERERFASHAATDYLESAFPPNVATIRHVVINSIAAQQLAFRKGVSSTLIPNVMDFENPPPDPDEITTSFKDALGLNPGETTILQPTRIVPRKRIETAIEFTKRLNMDCTLLVTHDVGDEGTTYKAYLEEFAQLMGVKVLFCADRIHHTRERNEAGEQIFSLADAYHNADLVTYPSIVEGFGNAFLETLYFKRPIVVHVYDVFRSDIRPKGFQVISYTDFIMEAAVKQARHLISNPDAWKKDTDQNYEIARRHYSYATLKTKLKSILDDFDWG